LLWHKACGLNPNCLAKGFGPGTLWNGLGRTIQMRFQQGHSAMYAKRGDGTWPLQRMIAATCFARFLAVTQRIQQIIGHLIGST
jgi:hypothetical protein